MSLLTPRAPSNALDITAWAEFEKQKERIYALRKVRRRRQGIVMLVILGVVGIVVSVQFLKPENVFILPETPAGQELTWVLSVLDGEPGTFGVDAVSSHLADELVADGSAELVAAELDRRAALWDTLRIVDFGEGATEFELWAELESEGTERGRVVVTVESERPHGLVGLSFGPSER